MVLAQRKPKAFSFALVLNFGVALLLLASCTNSKFKSENVEQNAAVLSLEMTEEIRQGLALYNNTCVGCHGPIATFPHGTPGSAKISLTINTNPSMKFMSSLYNRSDLENISAAIYFAKNTNSSESPTLADNCTGNETVMSKTLFKRMTTREFRNSVRDLFGITNINLTNYPKDYYSNQGFDNDDASLRLTKTETAAIFDVAQTVAVQATFSDSANINSCNSTADATARRTCLTNLLVGLAKRAYRQPVVATDITKLVDLAANTPGKDGITDAVTALLMSPKFLFHTVNYTLNASNSLHTLSQYEFASRLSFMIWSSVPDQELLNLAAANTLTLPFNIRSQISRMLRDPRGAEFMTSFPRQWLNYRTVETATRNLASTPEFTETFKTSAMKEVDLMFSDVLLNSLPADQLVTANYAYINRELAAFYGLPAPTGADEFARVNLDTSSRRGILTQAALMTATAQANTTSPIKRGVFFLNRVMCEPLGSPPPAIPLLERIDPSLPIKERLAQHRTDKSCSACHDKIDPVGLAFENFNSIGKYRTTVGIHPVDSSGVTVDGTRFNNASELSDWIAKGDRFELCAAVHVASYSLGREVKGRESCLVRNAVSKLTKNGERLSFVNLLEAIVSSDLFQTSKLPQ